MLQKIFISIFSIVVTVSTTLIFTACGCEEEIVSPEPQPAIGTPDDADAGNGDGGFDVPLCTYANNVEKTDCGVEIKDGNITITFGLTKVSTCTLINLIFKNEAIISKELVVSQASFASNDGNYFSAEGFTGLRLPQKQEKLVTFKYCPSDGDSLVATHHTAKFVAKTNSGDFNFELSGDSGRPDLKIEKYYYSEQEQQADNAPMTSTNLVLDFATVGTASPKTQNLHLSNTGIVPLTIYSAFIAGGDYSNFTTTFSGQQDIDSYMPNPYLLSVTCDPAEERDYSSTLYLLHDDYLGADFAGEGGGSFTSQPLSEADSLVDNFPTGLEDMYDTSLTVTQVPLKCKGGPAGCPIPVPKATKVSKGVLQKLEPVDENDYQYQWLVNAPVTVTLSAEDSWDPENDPMEYRWYILTEGTDRSIPPGSNAGLDGIFGKTESTSKETQFALDVVGEFIIYLEVNDNSGEKCGPVPIKLTSTPSQKVHVELMWSTPKVDLDVHLINTNAVDPSTATLWSVPCDAYWNNRSPDWGIPRAVQPGDPNYPAQCNSIASQPMKEACEWAAICAEPATQEIEGTCEDDPTLDIDATHQPRSCTPAEQKKYPELCNQTYARDCDTYIEDLKKQRPVDEQEETEIKALCRVDTGPENINIVNPKPGTYLILVHYFEGIFPSEARVRIYLNGKLQNGKDITPPPHGEQNSEKLQAGENGSPNELWTVAYIDWYENPDENPPKIREVGSVAAATPQSTTTCELIPYQ